MTNLIGPLELGPSIAIIAGAVALLVVVVTITVVYAKRRTSKNATPEDLEAKIQSNGSHIMTQKPSIVTSTNSSQTDLAKQAAQGDTTSTIPMNEPIRSKRIVAPERLQAFDPTTYGLRKNSISSINSMTGLAPSHLPHLPSMRSATPDSTLSKKWVDPRDIHFNRPSTPVIKPWVSPLDVHFSRPTTPLTSRPTTPASISPSRRFSIGSNPRSITDKNNDDANPTEEVIDLTEMSGAKLTTNPETSKDAQEGASDLESEIFPLPPTETSLPSNDFQAGELEQHDSPSRNHSRNHSNISIKDAPALIATNDHSGHINARGPEEQEASVNINAQSVNAPPDLSSEQLRERAFSIAASSKYSTNDDGFVVAGEPGNRSRSHSRSLDSQSRQQTHIYRRSSSARGPSPGLALVGEGEFGFDRKQSQGSILTPLEEHTSESTGRLERNSNDNMYDVDIETRDLDLNDDSSAQEGTSIMPTDQLAVPSTLEIGTAIPFGTGLHKRGASEASENSIGDFYDAYYRLSTMDVTDGQDADLAGQNSSRHDQESTVAADQSQKLDPERRFGGYLPTYNVQSQHDTGTGKIWRPKPQKLYFQSPNQQRPYDSSIPKQLQPQHIQRQQDFLNNQELSLPHYPHRKGTPAPPSFHNPVASRDNMNQMRSQQRISPPSQLDIGRTIVEMQSPMASPTFGTQGQSRYPSKVI